MPVIGAYLFMAMNEDHCHRTPNLQLGGQLGF